MLTLIALFVLGLIFGSFVNALVWRLHQQSLVISHQSSVKKTESQLATGDSRPATKNLSVWNGRSMCPNCRHELAAKDLIPVFSWLALSGRCRYCKAPISRQYPLIELITGVIFAASYHFWPQALVSGDQKLLFIIWLATSIGLLALAIYDFRWLLLPNKILYPTFFVALAGRLSYILAFAPDEAHSFGLLLLSLVVASGLFWLIFTLSRGKWIGYGDVRLGWILGTLLADPAMSFLMIFLASVIGTIFALPALISGQSGLASKLPFGPFLIAATMLVVLFGDSLVSWYRHLLNI